MPRLAILPTRVQCDVDQNLANGAGVQSGAYEIFTVKSKSRFKKSHLALRSSSVITL